jgi:hypothetical protein
MPDASPLASKTMAVRHRALPWLSKWGFVSQGRCAPLASIGGLRHLGRVVGPFSASGARPISPDGRMAFATLRFDERADLLPRARSSM